MAKSFPPTEAVRAMPVAAWNRWNIALDRVFYDVGALTAEERTLLEARGGHEGAIVVVPPAGSPERLRLVAPARFVKEQLASPTVDTLVVAGVGSSAVGTAALARDVADHVQRPVAGVISGLGLSDVVSEALGGWFVLGARNAMRDGLARMLDAMHWKDHVRDDETHREVKALLASADLDDDRYLFGSPDSAALLYILARLGRRIRLLVGHSKGNYSIENALEGWLAAARATGEAVPTDVCIVTLGAVIRFPEAFRDVRQVIGSIDAFGMLNSRPLLPAERVPGRWHSTNPRLPGALTVREALERVLGRPP